MPGNDAVGIATLEYRGSDVSAERTDMDEPSHGGGPEIRVYTYIGRRAFSASQPRTIR